MLVMHGLQEVQLMAKATRRYSAKLKFQVVLESLQGQKTPGQIAKAYGIHPNTIANWKQAFMENGPAVFERHSAAQDIERRIGDLEQLIGKKEVEIALLKNFLGRQ
jgi:transposase